MTAAHCTDGSQASSIKVKLAMLYIKKIFSIYYVLLSFYTFFEKTWLNCFLSFILVTNNVV